MAVNAGCDLDEIRLFLAKVHNIIKTPWHMIETGVHTGVQNIVAYTSARIYKPTRC